MPPLKIAIAGAGTAGLAAAAFLTRDGHDVRLFERFEAPRPLGAGLMLQPTGLACLARLGLDSKTIELGQAISAIYGDTVGGTRIFDVAYRELGAQIFGIAIHRGALFAVLHDEVRRLGVPITPAVEIARSRCHNAGRILVGTDGTDVGAFDLVIDATGTRSPLRAAEVRTRRNVPYPYGAVWGIVEEPSGWPHGDQLRQRYDGCHTMAGILPVGCRPGDPRRLAALFWSLRVQDYAAWKAAGIAAWQRQVVGLWPESAPFVSQIRTADDMTLATYSDMTLRECHGDRIVFVGDAGRTTSPQLGQGANLALIDALTLSECLRGEPAVDTALATYARSRRTHTNFYARASRWLTPFFQSDSHVAAIVRDRTFPLMGKVPYVRREMVRTLSGMKTGLFTHLDPGAWHAGYALDSALVLSSQPA